MCSRSSQSVLSASRWCCRVLGGLLVFCLRVLTARDSSAEGAALFLLSRFLFCLFPACLWVVFMIVLVLSARELGPKWLR